MVDLKTFTEDIKTFSMIDGSMRVKLTKEYYENHLKQASQMGYSNFQANEMVKSLIGFTSVRGDEVSTAEYTLVLQSLFYLSVEEYAEFSSWYNEKAQVEKLSKCAKLMYKHYDSDCYLFLLASMLISCDNLTTDSEIARVLSLFI